MTTLICPMARKIWYGGALGSQWVRCGKSMAIRPLSARRVEHCTTPETAKFISSSGMPAISAYLCHFGEY